MRNRNIASSYSIEHLDVLCNDGRVLPILFKDLSPGEVSVRTQQAKPDFLYDPLREIDVYRRILSTPPGEALGVPTLYAATVDGERQQYWLFLERVRGVALNEIGDLEVWYRAAAWLARLHAQFAGSSEGMVSDGHRLLLHSRDAHRRWIERAARFVRTRPDRTTDAVNCLEHLAEKYDHVSQQLLSLPKTLLHGEFFASNVLVERGDDARPGEIRPVDWELAAVGPGVMDLAALTAGRWTDDERERFADVYWCALAETSGQPAPSKLARQRSLAIARLHLAVQMVGWSQQWTPPPQHAHDWLADVQLLAGRLELL